MTSKFMNEVFDKHEIEQKYRGYIFGDTNNLPDYMDTWSWREVLKDLNEKIELTDKSMIPIYELFMELSGVSTLRDYLYFDLYKDEENYDKKYKLIIENMVELLSLSKKSKIEDILYKILDSDSSSGKYVAEYIFSNYKENEIIKILDILEFSYSTKDVFSNLLTHDYDTYFDISMKYFKNSLHSFQYLDTFLPIIKDEKIIKDLMFSSLIEYFGSREITYKNIKLKSKDIEVLENFLNGKKDNKFDKLADKISKTLNKKDENLYYLELYNSWLSQEKREFKDDFFTNLRKLSFAVSPTKIIQLYVNDAYLTSEEILNEYKVPMYRYLQYLISQTNTWDEKEKESSMIELSAYIQSNFDDFKKALELMNTETTMSVISSFYDKNTTEFSKLIIEMAPSASSKTIKNFIVGILEKDKANKDIIVNFLKEKKSHAREIGVMILTKWNLPDTQKLIKPLLKTEKNKAVKNLIQEYLATMELETSDESDYFSKSEILKRVDKNQHYIDVKNKPLLVWKEDNTEMDAKFSKYIVHLFNKGKKILKATEETKKVMSFITIESLTAFLDTVTDEYEQKSDWYMRAIPFTKSDKYLDPLKEYIGRLIYSSRGAAAAKIVDVIAEFKTTKAVQLLDYLSLKKNAKDARVNRGAVAAMDTMAKEMGLTKEDLLDFIIPDFGFDRKGNLSLDFGPRQFTVSLQPDLTMLIADNNGKKYKKLPKIGKNDDATIAGESTKLFKIIKKDLKKQVKLERERLERGFSQSRFWTGENWLKLFVNNPIMRTFAMGLVWGKYNNEGLVSAFRYLEDGSFSDFEDNELTVNKTEKIALVHPVELCDEGLDAWKEILSDYEITQPFEQINRPIFKYTDENKDKNVFDEFKGFMLGRFALRNGLFNSGWSRGSIEDAGCFYYYDKVYGDGTSVSLDFLGDYIGNYDDNKEVPIYDVKLSKNGHELKISEIPTRLYSELYYELKKVTDKGSGFNAEWEKVQW